MKRTLVALLCLAFVGACGGRVRLRPPVFPLDPVWQTGLDDYVVAPLATDGRRLFVATRGGTILALDQETGAIRWRVEGLPGRLAAAPGRLIVRAEDGTVTSLRVRNGEVRWTTPTSVTGTLAPTLDADRVYIPGRGLAAVEVETGRLLWTQASPADVTAPPTATTARLLVGEEDGTLRCLDRATGLSLWTHQTGGALRAPPLVDEERRRIYLGTSDKRILELKLDKGEPGWRWKVGADIQSPGLLLPDRVFFAAFDAVLYGLRRGGNLDWRGALPSRPLSGPQLVDGYVLIACHENEVLAYELETGKPAGSLRTAAEIRTGPLLSGRRLFVGLRNRSVVAYSLPENLGRRKGRRRAEQPETPAPEP